MATTNRQLEYVARGAAADLFRACDPELLIEGPAGTGKTRAILEKVNWLCETHAGIRVLICRATRVSMTESVLVTWESKVLWDSHPAISGNAARANRHNYLYPNGSEVICGGLDNPDRLMSTEYDLVCVFEATEATEEAWEKLLTRLRNHVLPFQQAVADCNPSFPAHWLNKRAAGGRMVRLKSRHADNPSVTPDYLRTLATLTGHRRERLYLGRWVAGDGVVFPEFDRRRHTVLPFPIPADWPVYWGYDPGYDHPTGVLWVAFAPNGCLYVVDEIRQRNLGVPEHARNVREREGRTGWQPVRRFADPQHAFSRTAQSPRTIAQQWADEGFRLAPWPRSTDVEAMVEAVRRRLIDGTLKVFATCDNMVEELESWRYKRNARGELLAGDDQFEDANNDLIDPLKGLVACNLGYDRRRLTVLGAE